MELDNIVQFLENKTILVTGASGFLAKLFVEKILRIQPNVKKLFLLIRAADTESVAQRLREEVIEKELFRVLRNKWGDNLDSFISEKVCPIPGNISRENLGINDSDLREEQWSKIDIVVNSAAVTKFDERYDVALGTNVLGARHVLDFAKKCAKLKMLLHISTAYVCGERAGIILEKPFNMGETLNGRPDLNIDAEKRLVEEQLYELRAKRATEEVVTEAMKDLGIQRAKLYGWPNTYVFTKAMGEMLLGHLKEDLPLVIIRPTIITSTYKEPFAGWIEGFRTLDSIAISYGKGRLNCFLGDPETIIDVLPADMVVNSIIVAIAAHASRPSKIIYQLGSSSTNPMQLSNLQDFIIRYFNKNQWINKDGRPVKLGKLIMFRTMASFQRYMKIRFILPFKVLQLANAASFQFLGKSCKNLHRRINLAMRMAELYRPYLFLKSIFDDTNTGNLLTMAMKSGVDPNVFYFDPKCIDWEKYFMKTHLPGLVNAFQIK